MVGVLNCFPTTSADVHVLAVPVVRLNKHWVVQLVM